MERFAEVRAVLAQIADGVRTSFADQQRPRLSARLRAAARAPLIVVTGSAGYGKSVAIGRLISTRPHVVYAVGADRATFSRFVRGLADAVGTLAPGARTSFSSAWDRAAHSGAAERHLARWMAEHLEGLATPLVFDDLHDTVADPRIAAFLVQLVALRANTGLVIASRRADALPVPRWMAEGLMERPVEAAELCFDEDDLAETARARGVALSARDRTVLLQRTRGAAAAVDFALARLTQAGAGAARDWRIEDAPGPSFEMVAEQILRSRQSHERAFLLETCVLPDLDRRVLERAGWPDALSICAGIGSDGAFMWGRDEDGNLRYFDRFRAFLQNRLDSDGISKRQRTATAAIEALEAVDRRADALVVATRHHLHDQVWELLDRYGFAEVESSADVVAEALAEIGPSVPSEPAVVTALRGYFDGRHGRLDTAEAWFSFALRKVEDEARRVEIVLSYTRDLMHRRRTDVADALEPYADRESLDAELLADVRSSLGQAYAMAGRHEDAARRSAQALAVLSDDSSVGLKARVLSRAAFVALEGQRFREADDLARRGAELAEQAGLFDVAVSAYSVRYAVSADVDDDAVGSLATLERLAECGVKSGSFAVDLYALLGIYELTAEAGDEAKLERLDRILNEFDVQYTADGALEALLPAQALRSGWRGEFAYAQKMLESSAEGQVTASRRALRWAEIALYATAAGGVAGTAVSACVDELVAADPAELQGKRARLMLSLVAWLSGESQLARRRLAEVDTATLVQTPRLLALHEAIAALVAPDAHSTGGRRRLRNALEWMHTAHIGGIARLIEALPLTARPIEAVATVGVQPSPGALRDAAREVRAFGEGAATIGADVALDVLVERFGAVVRDDLDAAAFARWVEAAALADRGHRVMSAAIDRIVPVLERRAAGLPIGERSRAFAALEAMRRAASAEPASIRMGVRVLDEVDAALNTLLVHLDVASPLMAEHSRAVSGWCTRLGRRLGLDERDVIFVARCGLIHDIGKVATPSEILDAPGALTADEWAIMRRHAEEGAAMVATVSVLEPMVPIVRGHHERLDGRGYPDGLSGSDIPLFARIVSVADCFNAMIGRRTYRAPMPPMAALAELQRNCGAQFDPAVVAAMEGVVMGLAPSPPSLSAEQA